MGLKNDIKFKILQELMQETNIERPISIWKLRDAVYGEISVEGDKEKKKNKRDNQIRTVKKDVFELEAEGIVTITEMDEDGKIDNKKNIICYNHPLSQKKLPFLIEHTFTMTATMEEKQEIIRDLITCAGAGNIKKYHCYLERFSPEYLLDDVGKAKVSKERKYPKTPQMEGEEVVRRAEPCHYTNLHENMSRIFEALSNQTGQFFRKISFKLIQYTKSGERAYVDGGKVYTVSPYFISSSNGKLWLVGNHEPYQGLSNYPIERMDEIQVLEPGVGRYRPMSELEDENRKLDKYRYVAEHQGGSYGSVEPIILRVRKTPNAYTVMYHTFDDEFYFLKGGTEEYDRVLVYRTAYFMANWAMMNSRDVIVETPSVQELIRNKMKELEGLYQTNE